MRHFAAFGTAAALALGLSIGSAATAGAASSNSSKIPPGTVLRFGDQLKEIASYLSLTPYGSNFPYKVEYSEFVGGPAMLQAFEGGSIDAGVIASTPLIQAQAAGQSVVAVAGWASEGSPYSLVSAPGVTDIKDWKDLKGKQVAFQEGTVAQSILLEGLHSAGLSYSDITPVNVPSTETAAVLEAGHAAAGIEVQPLTDAYLQANPTAKNVTGSAGPITDRGAFVIASQDAINNPAKSAAIADYVSRITKAFKYLSEHKNLVQQAYIKSYGVSTQAAQAISKQEGSSSPLTLPSQVAAAQQALANLYSTNGIIPKKLNVSKEFTSKYNSVVAKAWASS
jgi:sulfonate transport system substrate-binding protein